ncbi:hypothetical protein ACKAV7_008378 [Fusarium commune]
MDDSGELDTGASSAYLQSSLPPEALIEEKLTQAARLATTPAQHTQDQLQREPGPRKAGAAEADADADLLERWYAVRAISCEDAADRSPFKLTKAQTAAFNMMIDYAAELIGIKNNIEPMPTSSRIHELYELLENAALASYISVLHQFTKAIECDNMLVSILTVLGIRDDKTWESFANFTPKLSAILAISRVFLVKYTADKKALYIQLRVEKGKSRHEVEETSVGHLEIMSMMTRRPFIGGVEGWDTTPTQFIIRLRIYGMAASGQQEMPGASMLQAALQRAEALLYKHLLFCEEYKDQSTIELDYHKFHEMNVSII